MFYFTKNIVGKQNENYDKVPPWASKYNARVPSCQHPTTPTAILISDSGKNDMQGLFILPSSCMYVEYNYNATILLENSLSYIL